MNVQTAPVKIALVKPEDILKNKALPASMTPPRKRPFGVIASFILMVAIPAALALLLFFGSL